MDQNGSSGTEKDEIVNKFSKNMRKLLGNRETASKDSPHPTTRTVKFNPETIETSFFGTQTPGRIKDKDASIIETVPGDCPDTNRLFFKTPSYSAKKENTHTKTKVVPENAKSKLVPEKPPRANVPMKAKHIPSLLVDKATVDTGSKDNHTSSVGPTLNKTKITPLKGGGTPSKGGGTPLKSNNTSNKLNGLHESSGSKFKTPSPFKAGNRRFTMDELKDVQTPDCFNPVAFETPAKSKHRWSSGDVGSVHGDMEGSCSVAVAVRVRPFSSREQELPENKCVVSMIDNETVINTDRGDTHRFTYDYSFWSFDEKGGEFASQEEVYNHLAKPMLGKAFDGYNTCLFAYGQTGSGKSYSIMGHESRPEDVGIIPRFCDELFEMIERKQIIDTQTALNIEISYFEIYNEKIHDLLCPSTKDKTGKKPNLKVREHSVLGPYVEGLSTYVVKTYEDVKGWLSVGNKHRATAATGLNDKSSRSHSVFTLTLTQTKTDVIDGESHEHATTSKVNLVDLAGSERQSTAKTSGDRLREGASINKSLHTLGKVISVLSDQSALSNKKKKLFIPYRDSVLTWLLKESVGGNSKTAMLATISPAAAHVEETLSTLRYARQARNIINTARVNEDPKAKLIRELKAEIDRLKLTMGKDGEDFLGSSLAEIANLKEKLMLKELQMKEMSKTWQERLQKSEEKKMEEARILERAGIAFKVDKKLPNLVNLNEDPQLSEMLLYVLKPGVTKVGRTGDSSDTDVQLSGPLIADNHCTITNKNEKITITPVGDAPTYVNGDLIQATTQLHHGDRVILGGDHYFRFNYPIDIQNRKSGEVHFPSQPRDFEYAKQELTRVQNARLEEELEEARRKHEEELQKELEKEQNKAHQKMQMLKHEADEKLNLQKNRYEDRLNDLEKMLQEEHMKKLQSDSQAEDMIKKLELEKMMLEQEVISNRRRLELEAKAQQKAMEESKSSHSSLLDLLEGELKRINSEVQRLEVTRQKRGLDCTNSNTSTNLYKVALLVREANKISQFLKKHTTFFREDQMLPDSNDAQTLIKVTNTKLGISTYWTLDKFEDKLVKMREMYDGEVEDSPLDEDDVFYDPNDAWERDDRLDTSIGLSPKLMSSIRQQCSPAKQVRFSLGDSRKKIKFSSSGSTSSLIGSADSTLLSAVEPNRVEFTQAFIGFYRDVLVGSTETFKNSTLTSSFADRVLSFCDLIKVSVTNILQAYNADEGVFYENGDLLLHTSQLHHGLNSLHLVCSMWLSQYESLNSGLVKELFDRIVTTVKKLGGHMVLFLQGCESDIDSMVQEASSQVFDSLFVLCRACGELALATETNMTTLVVPNEDTESQVRIGVDLRKYFLRGCDLFIDKTLHGGLRTLEDCEMKTLQYNDNSQNMKKQTEDIVKQVELTVSSCKIMVEKLQQVQVELDGTLNCLSRDSLLPTRQDQSPRLPDYYHQSYTRSQALICHISNLADGVSLLTQATDHLIKGTEDSSLKRICRCTEMIQKATNHILSCSVENSNGTSSSSENSVLSDAQFEQIDIAGQEIRFATSTLTILVKKGLESCSSPSKSKRAIPLSPSAGSVSRTLVKSSPIKHSQTQKAVHKKLHIADLADIC